MIWKVDPGSVRHNARLARGVKFAKLLCLGLCLCTLVSCNRDTEASVKGCLKNTTLVDQNYQKVSLASLKGKPVVLDFIYTSCPGPCLMETAKLAKVAHGLGRDLGSRATIVSISVDPEHDGPKQMLDYARQQGVDETGWYFLTGSPADIDRALAGFKLTRERDPDGSVGHLEDMILLGPDGNEIREYNGAAVKAQTIVNDIRETLKHG